MNNDIKLKFSYKKLPWYGLLAALLFVILLRIINVNSQSIFVPGLVLFLTAAVRMFLSLRVENFSLARYAWITSAISLILAIFFVYANFFSSIFLTGTILFWISTSLFLVIKFGLPSSSNRPIWIICAMTCLVAAAAILVDPKRWFVSVTIGLVLCEIIGTILLLYLVNWRPQVSALINSIRTHHESALYNQYTASVSASEPIAKQVGNVWLFVIITILFGTHLERMGFTGNLGILPPLIALIGDMIVALVIAFLLILPVRVSIARILSIYENNFVVFLEKHDNKPILNRIAKRLYTQQIRLKMRLTEARFSFPLLLRQGLITGLPIVAILTAIVPILGTNWFFNTEEWATIGRDKWSAYYTDQWRKKMVAAANPGKNPSLNVNIPGLNSTDFSFVVVGDTGQGGLSQRELAKQIIRTSEQENISFVLVSSDVIYPNGEMKDYEAKFWSPFSGLTKPIVAIPGNHDWYDGIDSFAATFFTNDAANASINSRNNDGRAEILIKTANKLKERYRLSTQLQTSPYFKIETEDFILLCVDTGVVARVDDIQMDWLRRMLEEANDKTKMVLLGHPFFAWNRDKTIELPGLIPILNLIRKENVSIVMAGDTHDLEFYLDKTNPNHSIYHFVNGGGGAYISIDRAIGSPGKSITEQWAYYPSADALTEKLNENLPSILQPLWWFANEKRQQGQVFSGDVLSTALDQDKSPFVNSFVVISVEASKKQIRIIPYGVHGRLKWSDFTLSIHPKPVLENYAEWTIPMIGSKQ